MIVGQSGRDMTQTRNDEKALKSNQQISGNTASNSAANRNIGKKKKSASMNSHINYEMPLGAMLN